MSEVDNRIWDLGFGIPPTKSGIGGADGVRTHDPLNAIQVLSQLSYSPTLEN